ncbi:hypothetical protein GX51_00013 [Blastomyces parvus]|uniref:Uncharacterized protein n=1 Tax=Blastomyces parvus TaxID=2060905 RepID=A0A2B7XNS8_9EURO|nr:hypothetical protein GX51_00013 [Blastomyces parvus]
MNLWSLWGPLAAFFAVVAMHAPATAAVNATASLPQFLELPLEPPLDWLYKEKLGYRIIMVLDAATDEYDIYGWEDFVETQCLGMELCDSVLLYTVPTGEGEHRRWMGVLFRAPHPSPSDFYREDGIRLSRVFVKIHNDTASVD